MMLLIVFVFGRGHQSPTRSADPESKHLFLVKRRKKFDINVVVMGGGVHLPPVPVYSISLF